MQAVDVEADRGRTEEGAPPSKQSGRASEQPIATDEIHHLIASLDKVKNDPQNAIKIIKHIDGFAFTGDQLKETRIARYVQAVKDQPDPERASEDTEDLLNEIKSLKKHLMAKWKDVYEKHKKEQKQKTKKAVEEPPQLKSVDSENQSAAGAAAASLDFNRAFSTVEIPYLPQGESMYDTKDKGRNRICLKIITKL